VLRVCLHTDVRNQRSRAASNASAESSKGFSAPIAWPPTSSPRLGAFFDRRGGVAGGETAAALFAGTSLTVVHDKRP